MLSLILTLTLTCMLAVLIVNICFHLSIRTLSAQPADVSVLIPARNEERSIRAVIESCLSQEGVREILILDDHSTDRTVEEVLRFTDNRVRVIRGAALPEDWLGKNFACHQLAHEAKGAYLLFLDADVTLEPGAIRRAIGIQQRFNTSLTTLFPQQIAVSIAEKLAIPLVDFLVYLALPLPLVPRISISSLSAGNGQFLLFTREGYLRQGGHERVRGTVLEDIALSRNCKESGGRLVVSGGQGIVNCRMYQGHREVVRGFEKNVYVASGQHPFLLVLVLSATTFWMLVPYPLAFSSGVWAPLMLLLTIRLLHALAFRHPLFWCVVAHPAQILYAFFIALRSMIAFHKNEVTWKGRSLG